MTELVSLPSNHTLILGRYEGGIPADLLKHPLYYSVGEGVIAISDEVFLTDKEVMVIVQFPELQRTPASQAHLSRACSQEQSPSH